MARIHHPGKLRKKLTPTEALTRIYRYCAYQERSHQEVKNKLLEFRLSIDESDALLSRLITEGFVNEERFAKTFAGGKFRIKNWGRLKIEHELNALGLGKNCIQRGLAEIDPIDYRKTLERLVVKKSGEIPENNVFRKRHRIAQYLIGKGFEPELVWETIKEIFPG